MNLTNAKLEVQPLNTANLQSKTSIHLKLKECEPINICKIWAFGGLLISAGFYMGFFLGQFNNFFEFFARGKFKQFLPPKDYDQVQSILNGCLSVGAFLCTITGGILFKHIPYRFLMVGCMVIMIVINLLQIWAPLMLMYILRVFIGYIMCFYTFIGPIMVSQCLPSKFVGPLGSFFYVASTAGMLIAFTVSSDISETYWEIFLMIPLFTESIRLFFYTSFFYIESPYYVFNSLMKLKKKNSTMNLKTAFMANEHVDKLVRLFFRKEDFIPQKEFLYRQVNEFFGKETEGKGVLRLACSRQYRKAFFVVLLLNAANSMTGIVLIILYSRQIFGNLGFENVGLLVLMGGKLSLK